MATATLRLETLITTMTNAKFKRFNIDSGTFLREAWQQRPCLIPQAIPHFVPPIDADTLAGLALEEDIESRIVGFEQGRWTLAQGPFALADFQRDYPWTLLVQGVDQWLPDVAALRSCVDFLPSWRFDDVMVSYAVDGGSVGPHFDRYDVFLLQGEGQRLWRIGQYCDDSTPQLEHESLHLLANFDCVEEYLLNPGDALYIPPGYAHWGVAQGECTTFSLGFRAPTVADLSDRLLESVVEKLSPTLLLEDQNSISGDERPGEISQRQVANARSAVLNAVQALDDGSWLGTLVSETKTPLDELNNEPLPQQLVLEPASRVLWIENNLQIEVFCGGESLLVDKALLPALLSLLRSEPLISDTVTSDLRPLLAFLWARGGLADLEDL